jgi:hypothetical protein
MAWLPTAVYALSFLTSSLCAVLLARSFFRTHARLLLWSTLCFLFLAFNSLAVIIDILLVPEKNFGLLRVGLSLAGIMLLLFGLIWEGDEDQ